MQRSLQHQRSLRQLLPWIARRAAEPGRRRFCCGAASAGSRRDVPLYRFELENRLMFGNVVRGPGRTRAPAAGAERDPIGVTVVSESGFPENRVGKTVRPKTSKTSASAASASVSDASPPSFAAADASSDTATDAAAAATTDVPKTPEARRNAFIHARSVSAPVVDYMYPTNEDETLQSAEEAPADARLPSVSRVLQATMSEESREALRRWEQNMIAKHGEDGFARIKEAMFSVGRELHSAIHRHLLGGPPDGEEERPLSNAAAGFWRSVRPALRHVDAAGLAAAERPLRHSLLGYQGIVDCVAPFRSCPMVIEWKTARRPKYSVRELYDNPVQAAAYLGAYNYTHRHAQVDRAAVVVAYESGRPATVHVLSPAACRHYWSVWMQRLLRYRTELDGM